MNQLKVRLNEWLKSDYCLIAEPSHAFASSLQMCLVSLGIPLSQILIARKFEEARDWVAQKKPRILIAEQQLGTGLGFQLLEAQEGQWPEGQRMSFLLTKSSDLQELGDSAEEQVDAYLVKPFSVDAFQARLVTALVRKLAPSPYKKKLIEGKALLASSNPAGAREIFHAAKSMDKKPVLACYYSGLSYAQQGLWEEALVEYRQGLGHHAQNYKCLLGAFDAFVELQRFDEAIQLAVAIRKSYPLSARRLTEIFEILTRTSRFAEMDEFLELYTRTENRPRELVDGAAQMLYAAARLSLSQGSLGRALEQFARGFNIVACDLNYLDRAIGEFLKAGALTEAQGLLAKAPPSAVGTPELTRITFKVDRAVLPRPALIERARKLVMAGQADAEIYQLVVRLMGEEGKATLAESVITRAASQFPDLRAALYAILEEALGGNSSGVKAAA